MLTLVRVFGNEILREPNNNKNRHEQKKLFDAQANK